MRQLTVRFLDNEFIVGTANDLDLDCPDFHLEVSAGSKSVRAWIPFRAVKRISLGSGPGDAKGGSADKMVAMRFQDGEIVRGYLNGTLKRQQYGLTMTLYSVDKQLMQTIAIPYTSLVYLKSGDGRQPGLWRQGAPSPPLITLMRDLRDVTRLYRGGAISREELLERRRALLNRF